MSQEESKKRIEELTAELKEHNYRYYVLADPIISDREFDLKLKELEKLEAAFPQWQQSDSPSLRVGGQTTKDFNTIKHDTPMLSLGNTYSKEELIDFDNRIRKLIDVPFEYVCELKFDGFAIALKYQEGKLIQALTRGDGVQGDDVTTNVKTIRAIPHQLKGDFPIDVEVRGEVFMHKKAFQRLNEERLAAGEKAFANPRNSAAGTIKMQEQDEVAKRPLDCFIYLLIGDADTYPGHYQNLELARTWGLPVSTHSSICDSIESVWDFIEEWDKKRSDLSFEIDGVVVKVNSLSLQEELGFTAKSPRWAIAYKFETVRAYTTLESVQYQVGRTGAITPVANLNPVQLLGTTVKRASLHNADIIEELDLHIGDVVGVEKGGEIIPKIVEVKTEDRVNESEPVAFPTACPACQTTLIRTEGEAAHYCPNINSCPPQIKGRIEHFIGRKAMDIDSLGEGKVAILFDEGKLKDPSDLYTLEESDLIGLSRTIIDEETGNERTISFQEKTAENIVAGIKASLVRPFERVIYALGIRFVGETVARKLAKQFQSMDNLMSASSEQLIETPEIGQKIAQSVLDYFAIEENRAIIERLKEAGLNFVVEEEEAQLSSSLEGLKIVVSGVFHRIDRKELKALIEKHSGQNVGSISAKTSFVLAGDNMGPAKLEKARKLGVRIINEDEFFEMIGE